MCVLKKVNKPIILKIESMIRSGKKTGSIHNSNKSRKQPPKKLIRYVPELSQEKLGNLDKDLNRRTWGCQDNNCPQIIQKYISNRTKLINSATEKEREPETSQCLQEFSMIIKVVSQNNKGKNGIFNKWY